jgi:putative tryptophan/tyrosine transport system substrate-binding protein
MWRTGAGFGRRHFLWGSLGVAGLALLAGRGAVSPRPALRSARIGVVLGNSLDPSPEGVAFRDALKDLGYVEGQNLALTFRLAGQPAAVARAAAELIDQGVDVIVTVEDEATRAVMSASDRVPIVMADSRDPIGSGLIASLARPGGNVTGLTSLAAALTPKHLELLRTAAPGVSRVALLWHARSTGLPDLSAVQSAAQTMGVQLAPMLVRSTMNVEIAGLGPSVDGIIVLPLTSARPDALRVATAVNATRLPAIYDAGAFARAGGLLAYGANSPALFRRAAFYVDRILKGAKPADLPVEQPTTFDFVVNLKTAQTLGITLPATVLQQATEIIQ